MSGSFRLASSLALALLFAIRLPVPLALCTGPDGHRAIEPMHASCCEKPTHREAEPVVPGCRGESCTDTPLGNDPIVRNTDGDGAHIALAPAVVPAVLDSVRGLVIAHHALSVRFITLPPPRRQHTTVFIC